MKRILQDTLVRASFQNCCSNVCGGNVCDVTVHTLWQHALFVREPKTPRQNHQAYYSHCLYRDVISRHIPSTS